MEMLKHFYNSPVNKLSPTATLQSHEVLGDEREGIKSVLEGSQNPQFLPKIKLDY